MAKEKTSTTKNHEQEKNKEKVSGKKISHQKKDSKSKKWDFRHLTEEQKRLSIYGIIGILIIIVIIIAIFSFNSETGNTPEEKTENYLEKTVKGFYEDYYYEQLIKLEENEMIAGDVATFLSNYTTEGIPVSINVLINNKYITDIDEEVQSWQNAIFVAKALILVTTLAIPIEDPTVSGIPTSEA